jgi:hypothetical protein
MHFLFQAGETKPGLNEKYNSTRPKFYLPTDTYPGTIEMINSASSLRSRVLSVLMSFVSTTEGEFLK